MLARKLVVLTACFSVAYEKRKEKEWETDRSLRDRLHPSTRVAAKCKRGSTVLNIHLTFPSGYTHRWRTSISRR